MSSLPSASPLIDRRRALRLLAAPLLPMALGACVTRQPVVEQAAIPVGPSAEYLAMYGEIDDGRYVVPATDISEVDERFLRQEVSYPSREQPGTAMLVSSDGKVRWIGDPWSPDLPIAIDKIAAIDPAVKARRQAEELQAKMSGNK